MHVRDLPDEISTRGTDGASVNLCILSNKILYIIYNNNISIINFIKIVIKHHIPGCN